jgi:hypothetical protein
MNWFNNFSGGFNRSNISAKSRSARFNDGVNTSPGFGFTNGNTGWGNRSNESGRCYNYANQYQPYDNFLINGYNPEQYGVVNIRYKARLGEAAINSIDGRGGFCGNFAYPRSLYGIG